MIMMCLNGTSMGEGTGWEAMGMGEKRSEGSREVADLRASRQ